MSLRNIDVQTYHHTIEWKPLARMEEEHFFLFFIYFNALKIWSFKYLNVIGP